MNTSEVNNQPRAVDVSFTETTLSVHLDDSRTITVPLTYYPRLDHATPAQRNHWQLIGRGIGIHWPDVDEDLSTDSIIQGHLAPGGYRPEPKRKVG